MASTTGMVIGLDGRPATLPATAPTSGISQGVGRSMQLESSPAAHESHSHQASGLRAVLIITTLAGVNFLNTLGSGTLTIALPQIVRDVNIEEYLLLWPAAVYSLAAGCTLLIFGAVGDIVGPKLIWLIGATLYSGFTLGAGLCRTGGQLIAFRTILGTAIAMCLPTAVSMTTQSFLPGRWRNMAFAMQGMAQPLGYSVGVILGGVLTETIGWRWGFYISAIINAILVACAFLVLPDSDNRSSVTLDRLLHEIDWIGAITVSTSLGLLLYVLAIVSESYKAFASIQNIVLMVIAILLIPAFAFWIGYRERARKVALIPNSLWRSVSFTSTCIAVFFTWAVFNAFQYFTSLYFERVQGISPIDTSVRFLPMIIVGASTNILTGFLVDKIEVHYLVTWSAAITLISPLLMAIVQPEWGYWKGPFVAMLLSPLHPDVLFTVSNLIIAKAYPGKSQSLAGAVFNVVSQAGNSVGLAVTAAISSSISQHESDVEVATSLDYGYRAAYWTMFASMVLVVMITGIGLRKGGKVGASY